MPEPSRDVITVDRPDAPEVLAVLERHLAYAAAHSRPEEIFALDVAGLLDPRITFFSLRRDGTLLGVGALRMLTADHAELKSMHTVAEARGTGVGSAIVRHLLAIARERGVSRVSLETGTGPAFAPARSLYARAGFEVGGVFGDYPDNPSSTFMTVLL